MLLVQPFLFPCFDPLGKMCSSYIRARRQWNFGNPGVQSEVASRAQALGFMLPASESIFLGLHQMDSGSFCLPSGS